MCAHQAVIRKGGPSGRLTSGALCAFAFRSDDIDSWIGKAPQFHDPGGGQSLFDVLLRTRLIKLRREHVESIENRPGVTLLRRQRRLIT